MQSLKVSQERAGRSVADAAAGINPVIPFVSIPADLADDVTALAQRQGRSPADVVGDALRTYLQRQRWTDAVQDVEAAARQSGIVLDDVEDLIDDIRRGR